MQNVCTVTSLLIWVSLESKESTCRCVHVARSCTRTCAKRAPSHKCMRRVVSCSLVGVHARQVSTVQALHRASPHPPLRTCTPTQAHGQRIPGLSQARSSSPRAPTHLHPRLPRANWQQRINLCYCKKRSIDINQRFKINWI